MELEPPAPRLAAALGVPLDERVRSAMRLEMSYYREHAHEAGDATGLADLRERCAAIVSRELGREVGVQTLMEAIAFRPFGDAAEALEVLRGRGIRTICVSNWDCSLPEVLGRIGLLELLDGVVASATAGASKPEPAIFDAALSLAGCGASEALHVGDTPEEDVLGARAAGIQSLLLCREERPCEPSAGTPVISSLMAISQHLHS